MSKRLPYFVSRSSRRSSQEFSSGVQDRVERTLLHLAQLLNECDHASGFAHHSVERKPHDVVSTAPDDAVGQFLYVRAARLTEERPLAWRWRMITVPRKTT